MQLIEIKRPEGHSMYINPEQVGAVRPRDEDVSKTALLIGGVWLKVPGTPDSWVGKLTNTEALCGHQPDASRPPGDTMTETQADMSAGGIPPM